MFTTGIGSWAAIVLRPPSSDRRYTPSPAPRFQGGQWMSSSPRCAAKAARHQFPPAHAVGVMLDAAHALGIHGTEAGTRRRRMGLSASSRVRPAWHSAVCRRNRISIFAYFFANHSLSRLKGYDMLKDMDRVSCGVVRGQAEKEKK
jgi:hypothetical protein